MKIPVYYEYQSEVLHEVVLEADPRERGFEVDIPEQLLTRFRLAMKQAAKVQREINAIAYPEWRRLHDQRASR